MIRKVFLSILAIACLANGAAYADETSQDSPPLFVIGAGMFNIFRIHPCQQFQVEYRSSCRFWHYCMPIGGLLITSRGSSYVYGGIAIDCKLNKHLVFTPSISAGLYGRGRGKNLYYPLEFRSAIECAYIFDNQTRLGLQLSHLSNASLSNRNPGVEALVLTYSIPLP